MATLPETEDSAADRIAAAGDIAEVSSTMLSDRAYQALLDAILSLRLRPGQKLHVGNLSARMKLSPTPIKQALSRLAGEGLVTTIPHRGFYIARISETEMADLFDLRLMCELQAAERVLRHPPNGFVARLTELEVDFERLVDAQADRSALLLKDRDFHAFLVDQAGSPMLARWHRMLNVHVQVIRLTARLPHRTQTDGIIAGHRRIIQAFADGDPAATDRAIRAHIAAARVTLTRALLTTDPADIEKEVSIATAR